MGSSIGPDGPCCGPKLPLGSAGGGRKGLARAHKLSPGKMDRSLQGGPLGQEVFIVQVWLSPLLPESTGLHLFTRPDS